ncbi:hypothetical protein ACOCJ7_13480 [Knoellia sp. CPCC 206453]
MTAIGFTAATFAAIAAPSQAAPKAKVPLSSTLIGEWRVGGTLAGAPGNVHTGNINLSDGSGRLTALSAYDWQCPEESSSPDDGSCIQLRRTSAMDFEAAADLSIAKKLRSAIGSSSVVGEVVDGEGDSVPTALGISAAFTGAGPLTQEAHEQSDPTAGTYTLVVQERAAVGTVTYNGTEIQGVTGHIVTQTRR